MKLIKYAAIALACALTACGGGGGNSGTTKVSITSVKVAGASLADSGTFGYKFTVQSSTYPLVYTERVAATYGIAANLCPKYLYNGTTFVANPQAGCTNYAVAGASVNSYNFTYHAALPTIPTSAVKQLSDMAATAAASAAGGFTSSDLVIVGEFAANDVKDLVTAYSGLSTGGTDFQTMLLTLLDSGTVSANMGTAQGRATLGVLYMQKVADMQRDAINVSLLAHGATRVAVLNCLDVTLTPKFQAVVASLGGNGPAFRQMVQAWVQAYNAQLSSDLAAYSSKVAIVDFYTSFTDELNDLAQYSLSNSANTVCDEVVNNSTVTSIATAGTTSLADLSTVGACTATAASAITPHQNANGTGWWNSYLFADNFHPTPYGHLLLARLVAKRLTEAGWL